MESNRGSALETALLNLCKWLTGASCKPVKLINDTCWCCSAQIRLTFLVKASGILTEVSMYIHNRQMWTSIKEEARLCDPNRTKRLQPLFLQQFLSHIHSLLPSYTDWAAIRLLLRELAAKEGALEGMEGGKEVRWNLKRESPSLSPLPAMIVWLLDSFATRATAGNFKTKLNGLGKEKREVIRG